MGQGGFGITYEAYDKNLKRKVVIKEYFPGDWSMRADNHTVQTNYADNQENFEWGLDRFISEGQMLAKFNHPNITQVYSVFTENNTAYIVMRHEDGITLRKVLKMVKAIDYEDIRMILAPILNGLKQVHATGIIHRDIKPENIYIKNNGEPVLIDFGAARYALGEKTQALTMVVTPGYAPVEQYGSEDVKQGPWTDIYSLSATVYRCVSGMEPVDAITRNNRFLQEKPDPLISLKSLMRDRFPTEFLEAIDVGLSLKPQDRPQSIEEWEKILGLESGGKEKASQKKALNIVGMRAAAASDNPDLELAEVEASVDEAYNPTVADRQEESATVQRYRAFIPFKNQGFYLPYFEPGQGRSRAKLSWNMPAFLFAPVWFAYKKLFLFAGLVCPLLFLLAFTLSHYALAGLLVTDMHVLLNPVADVALVIAVMLVMLVSGLTGHYLYFSKARRYVKRSQVLYDNLEKQCDYLAQRSGNSLAAATIVLIMTVLVLVAGYLYLDKQNDKARTTTSMTLATLERQQAGVTDYFRLNQGWPENIAQLDAASASTAGVAAIHLGERLIVIDVQSDLPGLTPSTWTLAAFAQPQGDSSMQWQCATISWPLYLLPSNCRIPLK